MDQDAAYFLDFASTTDDINMSSSGTFIELF